MRKNALLLVLTLFTAVLITDSPAISVLKLFAGGQTWKLEEFAGFGGTPAMATSHELTAAIGPGDYYICKESPEKTGQVNFNLSFDGKTRPPDVADRMEMMRAVVRVVSP